MSQQPKVQAVPSSVQFFEDLGKLVVDAIGVAKSKSIMGALALLPEIQQVIMDAKSALPELSHLDAEDACAVGQAAYLCVQQIVAAA